MHLSLLTPVADALLPSFKLSGNIKESAWLQFDVKHSNGGLG